MKSCYVYIMASRSRRIYVGATSNLVLRVREHKTGVNQAFTRKYQMKSLVYYEIVPERQAALVREKKIKGWARWKKSELIETDNPEWRDLSRHWYESLERSFGR